jgi:hypothetical protein
LRRNKLLEESAHPVRAYGPLGLINEVQGAKIHETLFQGIGRFRPAEQQLGSVRQQRIGEKKVQVNKSRLVGSTLSDSFATDIIQECLKGTEVKFRR